MCVEGPVADSTIARAFLVRRREVVANWSSATAEPAVTKRLLGPIPFLMLWAGTAILMRGTLALRDLLGADGECSYAPA